MGAKKAALLFALVTFLQTFSFGQGKKDSVSYHFLKNCIIRSSDLAPDVTGVKSLDSLIKQPVDTAIIKFSLVGDISIHLHYYRLFKINNQWYYDSNEKMFLTKVNDISDTLDNYNEPDSYKHYFIVKQNNYSSLTEQYYYLVVVKNEIIMSLLCDLPINTITESDRDMNNTLQYFERFENYVLAKRPY